MKPQPAPSDRSAVKALSPTVSWAIWIAGPTGSGKSTLAKALVGACERHGQMVRLLTLEDIGGALGLGLPLASAAEPVAYRALLYATRLLTEAGVAVVIDAASPRRAWRDLARTSIRHYAEVELVCPPEVCGERAQAARWRATGVSESSAWLLERPYERSLSPELTVFTDATGASSAVEAVERLAQRLTREVTREEIRP